MRANAASCTWSNVETSLSRNAQNVEVVQWSLINLEIKALTTGVSMLLCKRQGMASIPPTGRRIRVVGHRDRLRHVSPDSAGNCHPKFDLDNVVELRAGAAPLPLPMISRVTVVRRIPKCCSRSRCMMREEPLGGLATPSVR